MDIKLERPVETPLGGKVRCIGCHIEIDFHLQNRDFVVTGVRLGMASLGRAPVNVFATRRGEAWLAGRDLKQLLERHVLPPLMPQLVATDEMLRKTMWAISLPRLPPTQKQIDFARRLKIEFSDGLSRHELAKLIDEKLVEKKRK